ncbi:MAG: hypothetical protein IPL94_00210 [Tetrasphaera sp.]|nr:hypothetical protein [Tetrasphaera sp.]
MSTRRPWELVDPAQPISHVLKHTRARVGDVVIARIDCESQLVTGTRRLRGFADAGLSAGHDVGLQLDLSTQCREIANSLSGERAFVDGGWEVPSGVFITLVCREGRVVPTARELGWLLAWRYANHLTATFNGDVYAVTPHGWIGSGDKRCGLTPTVRPDPPRRLSVVRPVA